MLHLLSPRRLGLALLVGLLLPSGSATPQSSAPRVTPRLEPVAETKLLMEGLAHANFRGLERQLRQRPAELQNWTFVRGQALLIAETANLLMLRPPRNQGQPVWFERAASLRDTARNLARAAAAQDFHRCRSLLVALANICNRCHTSFRIPTEIVPFGESTSN